MRVSLKDSAFRRNVSGYDAVRVALGLLLLIAAALKGYQLATSPTLENGLLTSRWFLIGVVEFELLFGFWLLSGLTPQLTWLTALGCFGAFSGVSLFKALSGEASCGCFGQVPVNPWVTLSIDLSAFAALMQFRPPGGFQQMGLLRLRALVSWRPRMLSPSTRSRLGIVAAMFASVGLPAVWVMASYRATELDEAGTILGDGRTVVLEPEKWIGKPFPLLRYIDVGDRLAEGKWLVLLLHYDCSKCQEQIPLYERLAEHDADHWGAPSVAFIEIPPFNSLGRSHARSVVFGRLLETKEWLVHTPLILSLEFGKVRSLGPGEQLSSALSAADITTEQAALLSVRLPRSYSENAL